jgi:hypothetical protein
LTKIGDFLVRVRALAPGSQLSMTVGSHTSLEPENWMTVGIRIAPTDDAAFVTALAGFFPAIVYVYVVPPTATEDVKCVNAAVASSDCD